MMIKNEYIEHYYYVEYILAEVCGVGCCDSSAWGCLLGLEQQEQAEV